MTRRPTTRHLVLAGAALVGASIEDDETCRYCADDDAAGR